MVFSLAAAQLALAGVRPLSADQSAVLQPTSPSQSEVTEEVILDKVIDWVGVHLDRVLERARDSQMIASRYQELREEMISNDRLSRDGLLHALLGLLNFSRFKKREARSLVRVEALSDQLQALMVARPSSLDVETRVFELVTVLERFGTLRSEWQGAYQLHAQFVPETRDSRAYNLATLTEYHRGFVLLDQTEATLLTVELEAYNTYRARNPERREPRAPLCLVRLASIRELVSKPGFDTSSTVSRHR